MIIKKIKLKDLNPSEYNPRKIAPEELEKLKKSITEYGYIEPIIWNETTKNVVGGHQRLKVLSKIIKPDEEIDVVVINVSSDKEKALNLALNKISGEWDDELLSSILKTLKDNELSLTGFNNLEIKNILKFTDIPAIELEKFNIEGTQKQRYCSIFYFNNEKDLNKVVKYFKNKSVELDTQKLLDLIDNKINNGSNKIL